MQIVGFTISCDSLIICENELDFTGERQRDRNLSHECGDPHPGPLRRFEDSRRPGRGDRFTPWDDSEVAANSRAATAPLSANISCMVAQLVDLPATRLLRALGDPMRFRLFRELPAEEAAELSVSQMARRLGVSDTLVSQHLRVLGDLGLVGVRRQGRSAQYYVNAAAIRAARAVLAEGMPTLFGPTAEQPQLSARNQLFGRVVHIRRNEVTAEVGIDIGGQVVTAVITTRSADRLGLQPGDVAAAVFKATEVMVLK